MDLSRIIRRIESQYEPNEGKQRMCGTGKCILEFNLYVFALMGIIL